MAPKYLEEKEVTKEAPYVHLENIRVVSFFESFFKFTKLFSSELELLLIILPLELRSRVSLLSASRSLIILGWELSNNFTLLPNIILFLIIGIT